MAQSWRADAHLTQDVRLTAAEWLVLIACVATLTFAALIGDDAYCDRIAHTPQACEQEVRP